MNRLYDLVDVIGRVLIAALFIEDGWTVINNYASTADYIAQHGIPASLLPLALVTQLGGGVLVILGLLTRLSALALGIFCLTTAIMFHAFSASSCSWQMAREPYRSTRCGAGGRKPNNKVFSRSCSGRRRDPLRHATGR